MPHRPWWLPITWLLPKTMDLQVRQLLAVGPVVGWFVVCLLGWVSGWVGAGAAALLCPYVLRWGLGCHAWLHARLQFSNVYCERRGEGAFPGDYTNPIPKAPRP